MDNTLPSKKQQIIDLITEGLTDCKDPLAVTFTLNAKLLRKRYNVDLTLEDGSTQNIICNEILRQVMASHVKYLCITEYTKDGMWHSHGILFKVSKKFKIDGWSKIKRNLGYMKIKKIDDMKKWTEYITKDDCDSFIYSFDYSPESLIRLGKSGQPEMRLNTCQFSRIIKLNAKFYKEEAVREVITPEDYDCYKLKKAKSHVMAAARMFRKAKVCKNLRKCKKNCIII